MSALRIKNAAEGVEKSTPKEQPSPWVMTIGHSTRTLEEFIGLLKAHGATCVVDVRTVPRSWHNPQFNKASLPRSLKKAGLGYVHLPGLGGLRHAKRDSSNVGWRNASFRGYADHENQHPDAGTAPSDKRLWARRELSFGRTDLFLR